MITLQTLLDNVKEITNAHSVTQCIMAAREYLENHDYEYACEYMMDAGEVEFDWLITTGRAILNGEDVT